MRSRVTRLASVVMLAAGVGASSVAGAAGQGGESSVREVPAGLVAPGPLGQPLSHWITQWYETYYPEHDSQDLCHAGDQGQVFLLPIHEPGDTDPEPGSMLTCPVRSDQSVLALLGGNVCYYRPTRTWRPDGTRIVGRKPASLDCLTGQIRQFTNPHLAIDGEAIAVDDRFFAFGRPVEGRGNRGIRISPAWAVMIEPLAPGTHVIETGITITDHRFDETTTHRSSVTIEVAE